MAVFAVILTMVGGISLSSQSSVNANLGRRIGTIEGALMSFLTGTGFLIILVLFFGQGNILGIFNAPIWQLAAVFCGVFFIMFNMTAIPIIGVISTSILVISGQLSMGLVIDHFGWFSGEQIPLDGKRIAGFLFMMLALYFIYKGSTKRG